ncbi:hypothetical protein MBLNU13_g08306t1 [Cladosporium sp. NU13]
MATANITVIGSLMVDHIFFINRMPEIGETYPADEYKKAPGGKGANSAIAAFRSCHVIKDAPGLSRNDAGSNIRVRMIGAVGLDPDGAYMLKALRDNEIDTTGVLEVNESTGMMFVMVQEVEDSMDNRLISTRGANAALTIESFATADKLYSDSKPDLIISQLELELSAIEKMLETAGRDGIKVLLNAAPATSMLSNLYQYVTHLVVNETEAAILSGSKLRDVNSTTWEEITRGFLDDRVENVVITLGARGAYYANNETSGQVSAFKIVPVDPTGAGDTFTGAYAAEYVRQEKAGEKWDIEKAVKRACAAGALTVTRAGAQEGIPWADQIDELLVENSIIKPETVLGREE